MTRDGTREESRDLTNPDKDLELGPQGNEESLRGFVLFLFLSEGWFVQIII